MCTTKYKNVLEKNQHKSEIRRPNSRAKAKVGPHSNCNSWFRGTVNCGAPAMETSQLPRLQAQTLPNETSPTGKNYPTTKMVITFEPVMRF